MTHVKIVIQHTDIATMAIVVNHGIKTQSADPLFNWMWQTYLQRTLLRLITAKRKKQKQYTIALEPGEVLCYKWTLEHWQENGGTDYETTVSTAKVIEPILKQLNTTV